MKEREAPQPVYTDATRSTVPSEFAPVYAIKTARAREYGCCFSASLQRLLPEDDSAQLSGGGSHHEKLMHHAIDIFCSRPLRNLDAAPRAGEVVALQAYERIVRKALAANESDVQLLARLKAAGVVAEQAAAAAGAYKSRLSEMLAHLDEETAKISGPYLADVDWKVNLSLASSTASSLRKPSVQLALYLDEEGAARKEVVMELERAQLDMMIESVSALLEATDRIPIPQAL